MRHRPYRSKLLTILIATAVSATVAHSAVSSTYDVGRQMGHSGSFSGQVGEDPVSHILTTAINAGMGQQVYGTVDKNEWQFRVTVTVNRNVAESSLVATLTYIDSNGMTQSQTHKLRNNNDSCTFSGTASKQGQQVVNANLAQVTIGTLEVHAKKGQWLATAYDVKFWAAP